MLVQLVQLVRPAISGSKVRRHDSVAGVDRRSDREQDRRVPRRAVGDGPVHNLIGRPDSANYVRDSVTSSRVVPSELGICTTEVALNMWHL